MQQEPSYTRHLRRSRSSAFVTLIAMAFQLLFAIEHGSAMAVAAAKGGSNGSSLGILEICTARGLLRIPAPAGSGLDEQPAPRSSNGESCAVCGSASVSGATNAPNTAVIVPDPHLQKAAITPPAQADKKLTGFRRSGSTRGPPGARPHLTI